jgi:hypothetical protein
MSLRFHGLIDDSIPISLIVSTKKIRTQFISCFNWDLYVAIQIPAIFLSTGWSDTIDDITILLLLALHDQR